MFLKHFKIFQSTYETQRDNTHSQTDNFIDCNNLPANNLYMYSVKDGEKGRRMNAWTVFKTTLLLWSWTCGIVWGAASQSMWNLKIHVLFLFVPFIIIQQAFIKSLLDLIYLVIFSNIFS